ncbi:MAG: GNAT family N-acetyltransferase [Verrucomicrobiales bacterium]|nr:GNAT family N-acetyltransferase [Verrucomicrobiales bacterium]
MKFRQLSLKDETEAYTIHCQTVDWLLGRKIRQWTRPVPESIFVERIERGEMFCMEVEGQIAAIVTILRQEPGCWQNELGSGTFTFISTLCTGNDYRGNNYGKALLSESIRFIESEWEMEKIYLDCVVGDQFLPKFYHEFGFKDVAMKGIEYPTGVFEMLLMVRVSLYAFMLFLINCEF